MGLGFLDHVRRVPDHRIPGMTPYPLEEIFLAALVAVVCGADDWEGVETVADGALDWLRGFLPFAYGVPTAQTFRKVFRLLDARAFSESFAAWAASVRRSSKEPCGREIVAVEGKVVVQIVHERAQTPTGQHRSCSGHGIPDFGRAVIFDAKRSEFELMRPVRGPRNVAG